MKKSTPKTKLPFVAIASSQYPLVSELPTATYVGIGKIISAHAILENKVLELLCELVKVDESVGRVTFRYQSALERFKIVERLLVLYDIKPKTNLKSIRRDIERSCQLRDTFAHGIWSLKDGDIALRITKGEYETDDGIVDRSFVPQASKYSDCFFERNRVEILKFVDRVRDLKNEVVATSRVPPAKS